LNYDFPKLKDLMSYIEEQHALTDNYRGSLLLYDFDIENTIKVLKDNKWDDESIMTYIISSNPVLWAHCWLRNPKDPREPLHLYHYQKSMLNCQHKFKVTRCGRQIGKTLCMAIDIIWTAMTRDFTKLLYVAPYKAQVKVLYEDTLMMLIRDVPEIHNSIVKSPTHPYYKTEISNGATISAMTAGSRSGQKGSSIRGQSNIYKLYLDEVEYMGTDAINSIMPTISANEEGHIWASSTPTGKREEFYHWCTDHDSPWRCPECEALGKDGTPFHYPASISPMYTKDLEKVNRASMPASKYEHEYDAEWGEEVEGVFRHTDIDACLAIGRTGDMSYTFDELVFDDRNKYIIGVDWNKESTGVQIVILEYNPNNTVINRVPPKYFRLFGRETITAKEFTERGAVARLLKIMKEIPISHVYADEGYGTLQVQVIRKILEKEAPGMANRLVAINMRSTQVITDPTTKLREDKPMKPFMVDNAARIIEDRRMILPDCEDEKALLVGQMREYVVIRRSQSGYPVYSPDNEDILTAFMLAILGYICEYNEVVKSDFTQRVSVNTDNSISLRAANQVVPRVITHEDDGRPPIDMKHQRPSVFESIAKSMGMDYQFYPAPGYPEDDGMGDHSLARFAPRGSTGRGAALGNGGTPTRRLSKPRRATF
jgi:hypothetical protein